MKHALIIQSNKVIEGIGSELDMIVKHSRLMRLFDRPYDYWSVVPLSAVQLQKYKERNPGELAYYEDS